MGTETPAMNLETGSSGLEGKMVGRVGVEPTTKRLRVQCPNTSIPEKNAESPLIEESDSGPKDPSFVMPLRGIISGLLLITALVSVVAFTLWAFHTPESHHPAMGTFHCDKSWHLPCDEVE